MPIGFRVKNSMKRIDASYVEAFRVLPVANVSDSMSRLVAGGDRLRPMHSGGVLAGPALTVKTCPGDNLMLHKAIDMAAPGDVIVVDAGGDTTNALMGELMLAHAVKRGVAGFVLNGAIRDAEAIRAQPLPLYALGVTHRGPYRTGPGEIGFQISIAGMVINPGDLMLGDIDGIVCVPKADAEAVLKATRAKQDAEAKQMAATLSGTMDRSWVDRELERLGCALVD
ncbi:RraA family protein [Ensifer sp. T173]|uniref:Putative 4-hydroxy-4-methyl-2-oxoglutarate aldolase n=1 Tax=Ensifer canadensis TaxID=555315 RepID=A0AAW4FTD7_9HYPH|nr:RraA family protein [Ensifer canadensis]MBM3094626.1 RraA family protein [Ensifer canadensis]UBI78587.1 RraA family protein [Ensifer canadensis]